MASTSTKRKRILDLIVSVLDKLDRTGANSKKYISFFNSMNDKQFETWMKKFSSDPDMFITMEVLPFKNEPKFSDIEAAAKVLDLPLEEYVYLRDEKQGHTVRTPFKIPVMYIYVKRLQQIVAKKTAVSSSIKTRNAITNQVTSDDKVSRMSDEETNSMIAQGNFETLKEMMGPRAGNAGQKRIMYNNIARDGFVKLSDVQEGDSVFEKPELNALDVYLLGMGLKSDLVTDGMKLIGSYKSHTE